MRFSTAITAGVAAGVVAFSTYTVLYTYFASSVKYSLFNALGRGTISSLINIATNSSPSGDVQAPLPFSVFKLSGLFVSTSFDQTRTTRQYHISFQFDDYSIIPPAGTHCDLIWPVGEDPPTKMTDCSVRLFKIKVGNFQGMKQFDLSLLHLTSWLSSRGLVSLSADFPGWRDPRSTSGGTYYAVANDTITVDIGSQDDGGDGNGGDGDGDGGDGDDDGDDGDDDSSGSNVELH